MFQLSCLVLFFVYLIWKFPSDRDPDLVKRIGAATALEVRATGIPYAFAPCIAVNKKLPQNTG
jgi:beta-glucosidase-like glycosyl hydrolase